jgi:hypothetical protein
MWGYGRERHRWVMFRTTLAAHAASDVASACDWPYVDSPYWVLP